MIQRNSIMFGNQGLAYFASFIVIASILLGGLSRLIADDGVVVKIIVEEDAGLAREKEYVTLSMQLDFDYSTDSTINLLAEDIQNGEQVFCQLNDITYLNNHQIFASIVFPISISPNMTKEYHLKKADSVTPEKTDLKLSGEKLNLFVENEYYRADLTKEESVEPQSHDSGQIRELLVKMGINQLLTNAEDRVHWAPNFKRPEIEWYTTIAHWDFPKYYKVEKGPYLIRTVRSDLAPEHPEIALTAVYNFYANVPYFKFFSSMEFVENVWLELLRNDEMTMDTMFTDLAFQRPDGKIIDVTFAERKEILNKQPIENNAPWLCFYNRDIGFGFASIRLRYDNTNQYGANSPTYKPHTQIGEWLAGITYWNRRLVHDHLSFIPKGSRYAEENAYLVFELNETNRFDSIVYWAERLRQPVKITIQQDN